MAPLKDTLAVGRLMRAAPGALMLWGRVDERLSCVSVSQALADMDGVSIEGHLGKAPSEVLPEIGPVHERAILTVFATGDARCIELRGPTPASPGVDRAYRAQYAPVWDHAGHQVEYVIGLVEETTELERSRSRVRVLDESGELLGTTLDAGLALARLADMLLESFTDFVVVRLLPYGGGLPEVFLVRHREPAVERVIRSMIERFALPADFPVGPPAVIASGRPELLPDFAAARSAFALNAEHERALEELGVRSMLSVPLTIADRRHGALTIGRIDNTWPFDEEDVTIMIEIARRAGMAVENARVHGVVANLASASDALEQLDEGVVMVGANGLVLRMNAAAESLLGTPRQDALGRPPGRVNECMRAMVASALDVTPGERVSFSKPMACPGHAVGRWMSVTRTSSRAGCVYTLRDVTSSYDLERLTDEFIATVSHELLTPLTVLQGGAQTLRDLGPMLDQETQAALLEDMATHSQRLAGVVTGILRSRQLGAGNFEPQPEAVDVCDVARSVLAEFVELAPDGVELRDETGREPCIARADPKALRQVVVNLVDNAIRYSPDGGTVTVRTATHGDVVQLQVSDDGMGIPFIHRDRVFEKFVRLDAQHRYARGGSGLGLYMSRKLVRGMGGEISITDAVDGGATFTVRLPRASHPPGA